MAQDNGSSSSAVQRHQSLDTPALDGTVRKGVTWQLVLKESLEKEIIPGKIMSKTMG